MILGSGRLASRLAKILKKNGQKVISVASREFKEIEETEVQESSMDYARDLLKKRQIANVSSVCIVDADDAINIYLLMAVLSIREEIPICAAFYNESLVSQLALKHKNVKIFNPASIVSKLFADVVPNSLNENDKSSTPQTYNDHIGDGLVLKLIIGFLFLIFSGAWFFKVTENVRWLNGFYLVITVITSVNFNDAELTNYSPIIVCLRMGLMLATYAYVIIVLAFIIDEIVKRRTEVLMYGRRRYNNKDHVILCGLGRVGYAIAQELILRGEDIIIIESDPENKYLPAIRAKKIPVLVGDATLSHYLIDAGIGNAKALICAVDSDLVNLEIGLNSRAVRPHIRLILRIFDNSTAIEMKKRLNINYVFSKSFMTANLIYESIVKK